MTIYTLDDAYNAGGTLIIDADFRTLHRDRLVPVAETVAEFNAADWKLQKRVNVAELNAVFVLDAGSVEADNGTTVLHDSEGNVYVLEASISASLPVITSANARQTLAVDSSGEFALRTRQKHVILAYAQSNFSNTGSVAAWTTPPPNNLFVWNGGNWNGNTAIASVLGTAFAAASPTLVSVPICYAAMVARANPEWDVYLVVIARGGTSLRAVVGLDYLWDDGTSGDPGTGYIGFNNATTASATDVRYSETDADGYIRYLGSSALGANTFYKARIEVIGSEATDYVEFNTPGSATDNGTYRNQTIDTIVSANWPPADGTPVRVFEALPLMATVLDDNIEAAFTALGLSGDDRKFDKVFTWPTEGDLNYYDSYVAEDYPKLLAFLETWTRPETPFLYTLPWPFGTGISSARSPWWDAIGGLVASNFDTRKLVSLEGTDPASWGDENSIHVISTGMESVGTYIYNSELRGGTAPRTVVSDQFTPTFTAVTNVDSVTSYPARYIRVGQIVDVGGMVGVDATADSATATEVGISLPLATDFILGTECNGVAIANSVTSYGVIGQDGANDRAKLVYLSNHTTSVLYHYRYSYRYIPT